MFSKDLLIVVRTVLAARCPATVCWQTVRGAIRMMNAVFRRPAQGNRHVEGSYCQVLLHPVADGPTYHPKGMQIKDERQINPAFARPDIGDVASPFRCADLRFWLGWLAAKSCCKRFGAILNVWSLSVVASNLWFLITQIAFCRIKRPTLRCPTRKPSSFSSSVILGRP